MFTHSSIPSFVRSLVPSVLVAVTVAALGAGCATTGTGTEPIYDAAQHVARSPDSSNADSRVAEDDRWSADRPAARRF